MLELISVHAYKTGGVSLEELLRRKYGKRFRQFRPAPSSGDRAALLYYIRHYALPRMVQPTPHCIHGHFPASRYWFHPAPMIVFVRDPVEIQVSMFHYIRRAHAETGMIWDWIWRAAIETSETDFMSVPVRTLQTFMDVPMGRFSFIGAMTSFDDDMRILSDRLSMPYARSAENVSPPGSYEISPKMRRIFHQANPGEQKVYERALARRDDLMRQL